MREFYKLFPVSYEEFAGTMFLHSSRKSHPCCTGSPWAANFTHHDILNLFHSIYCYLCDDDLLFPYLLRGRLCSWLACCKAWSLPTMTSYAFNRHQGWITEAASNCYHAHSFLAMHFTLKTTLEQWRMLLPTKFRRYPVKLEAAALFQEQKAAQVQPGGDGRLGHTL